MDRKREEDTGGERQGEERGEEREKLRGWVGRK